MFKARFCHRGLLSLLCIALFFWSSAETDGTIRHTSRVQLPPELMSSLAGTASRPTASKPRANGFTPYPTFVPGQSPQSESVQQQIARECSYNDQCDDHAASDELYVPLDQQTAARPHPQPSATSDWPVQQQEQQQQNQHQQLAKLRDSTSQASEQQPASEAVPQPQAQPSPSLEIPQPASAAQPQADTTVSPPAAASTPRQPLTPHPARRLLNLALLSDGASVLAANPEARRPERAIDKDIDSFMKNDCNAAKWIILELSQLGTVETVKLTMKELYSSRVHTFRVFGRSTHPRKDGPDLTAGIKSASWQLLGTFAAENKRGTQSFSLPQRSRVRYILLVFDTHYGTEAMCALNMIEVLGVSAAQELEEALALQEELESEELFQQMQQQVEQDEQQQALQQHSTEQQPPLKQADIPVADVAGADVAKHEASGTDKVVEHHPAASHPHPHHHHQQQQQQDDQRVVKAVDLAATDSQRNRQEPQYVSSRPQDAPVTTSSSSGMQPAQPAPDAATEHPGQGITAGTAAVSKDISDEAKQARQGDRSHHPSLDSDVIAIPITPGAGSAGRESPAEAMDVHQGSGLGDNLGLKQLLGQQPVDSELRSAATDASSAVDSSQDLTSPSRKGTTAADSSVQQQTGEAPTPPPPPAAAAGGTATSKEQASEAPDNAAKQPIVTNPVQGADVQGNAVDTSGLRNGGKMVSSPEGQAKAANVGAEDGGGGVVKPGSMDVSAPAATVRPVQLAGVQQGGLQQAPIPAQHAAAPTQQTAAQQQQQPGIPVVQQQKAQQPARDTVLTGGTAKPKQAGNLFDIIKSEMMQLKLEQGKVHKKLDGLGKRDGEHETLLVELRLQQSQLSTQLDLLSAKVDGLAAKVARAEVVHQHNTHHHHHHHTAGPRGSHVGDMSHSPGAQQEHPHSLHISLGRSPLGANRMPVCQSGLVQLPLLLKPQYLWVLTGSLAGSATLGLLVVLLHPSAEKLPTASRVAISGLAVLNLFLSMVLSLYLVLTSVQDIQQRTSACQLFMDPSFFAPKYRMIGNGSAP